MPLERKSWPREKEPCGERERALLPRWQRATCQVSLQAEFRGSLDGPPLGHGLAISPLHCGGTTLEPVGESQ